MKVAVFSTKRYDRDSLQRANMASHELVFLGPHLNEQTAKLAAGFEAICVFVNDQLSAAVIDALADHGTRLIALRCAGFNNVDLSAAHRRGLAVARVPAYSPYAVAEHSVALILALNRHLPRAYNRVRDGNLTLDGLLGFDLHGRTAGLIGAGTIGTVLARILIGFGCTVLAFDPYENPACRALGVRFVPFAELCAASDIISLHCPLLPENHHIINAAALAQMRDGVMLINTSRGALIDTPAVIEGLKSGRIGYLGLDVYEEEGDLFFEDLSSYIIRDDVFSRLLTFPNVIITGHQAFFTREALDKIASTTIANITEFETTGFCQNAVPPG